jgi:hypothetical protein
MIVVADSGPPHSLILLQQTGLLRPFGQVLVPEPVASELAAAGAPGLVREWITKPSVGGRRERRCDARYTKTTSRRGRFSWRRYP